MPHNPVLYPDDFPNSDSIDNPLSRELIALRQQVQFAAIRQVQSRRLAGRNAAIGQNETVLTTNTVMSLDGILGRPLVSSGGRGYFVGGTPGYLAQALALIDRLNYSNEALAVLGQSLSMPSSESAGFSSSSNGYIAGNYGPTIGLVPNRKIDKINFDDESISSIGASLSLDRWGIGGCSSRDAGFAVGGHTYARNPDGTVLVAGWVTVIDRFNFLDESLAPLGATLTQLRGIVPAISTGIYGYFGGLATPGGAQTLDKLNLATNLMTTIAGTLAASQGFSAVVHTKTAAYLMGGMKDYGLVPWTASYAFDITQKFDFSNEGITTLGAKLSIGRAVFSGVQSPSIGYVGGGGVTGLFDVNIASIDRFVFSNESMAPSGLTLSSPRFGPAPISTYNPSNLNRV